MHHLLHDIGIAVLTATLLGLIAHWLKQPIILGYLLAGALVGPQVGFGLIHGGESIEIISEIGLVLLLFVIGLEMDVKSLLASGKQLLVAGFGQFLVCAALGAGLFALLGYGFKGTSSDGLYLALMCGLSSTAIVVKLLSDKAELDTIPGRITIGTLVIQDIYAIFVLAFQPNFANPTVAPVIKAVVATVALLVAGFLFSKYVLRWVFASIAKAPEMVVAVSIGWCATVAGAAGAMGLSKEMGALVAGLSIAAFPYKIHVTAKTLPLRDFFLTLFFLSLGMKITPPRWEMAGLIAAVVGCVIATRFLSVYPLLALCGSGRRTAFITSLNLAQVSEFSMVIASLGVFYGHIGQGTVAAMVYAMAITAVLSSYAIRYNHGLYVLFDRLLHKVGLGSADEKPKAAGADAARGGGETGLNTPVGEGDPAALAVKDPVVILGFHRGARELIHVIGQRSPDLFRRIHVVDFNPEVLRELGEKGIVGSFGDISSLDTLEHAHLHRARMILCTIPDMLLKGTNNLHLVKTCRAVAPHAAIVATGDDDKHDEQLREAGADFVVKPYGLIADHVAGLVGRALAGDARDAAETHGPRRTAA